MHLPSRKLYRYDFILAVVLSSFSIISQFRQWLSTLNNFIRIHTVLKTFLFMFIYILSQSKYTGMIYLLLCSAGQTNRENEDHSKGLVVLRSVGVNGANLLQESNCIYLLNEVHWSAGVFCRSLENNTDIE